jgi:hypothetical protein
MTGIRSKSLTALGFAACVAVGYPLLGRRWCLTWGADAEEVRATMPGDALSPGADVVTTRAVAIAAPASAIWPWLVQMGPGRGGAYTYDWIENLLGLDMHSADRILPEFQETKIGDTLPLGRGPALRVEILEPERALVLRSEDGAWVWALGLYPRDDRHGDTRLISRNRITLAKDGDTPSLASRVLTRYVMEPGSLVMERKMLLGIKKRAEAGTDQTPGSR